eukprot:TRINITY_DN4363_c0_g1_i4.p1 TRINITY_DN4363_c0_g1~~TRINITY_DN4363_c0_g1_i4.p1  ORF type:complete len:1121 (-),score=135.27 TRINITY_DN4363_c0_g1_i4:50-3412(-)
MMDEGRVMGEGRQSPTPTLGSPRSAENSGGYSLQSPRTSSQHYSYGTDSPTPESPYSPSQFIGTQVGSEGEVYSDGGVHNAASPMDAGNHRHHPRLRDLYSTTEEEGTEDEKVMGVSEFLNLQRELARMREMLYDDKKGRSADSRRDRRDRRDNKKKNRKSRKHKHRHSRTMHADGGGGNGNGVGNGGEDGEGNGADGTGSEGEANERISRAGSFDGLMHDDEDENAWRMHEIRPSSSPKAGQDSLSPRPRGNENGGREDEDEDEDEQQVQIEDLDEGEEIDLHSDDEMRGQEDVEQMRRAMTKKLALDFDSSTDSEVTDTEFIYVQDEELTRKLRNRKRKKRRKKRRRQAEAMALLSEEGMGMYGGGFGEPMDDEAKYYARGGGGDNQRFDGFTPTLYGSFQKDLADNAKKFAEQIHRRGKQGKSRDWPGSVRAKVSRGWEEMQLDTQHNFMWLYILWLGALTACTGIAMDYAIIYIQQVHYYLTDHFFRNYWARYCIWVFYLLFWAGCAMLVTRLAPTAQGSGVPEMKSILSGVNLKRYLTFPTLIVKIVSITCSVGSGLVLGKVGPFIHVCATMANQLARFPLFHRIRENPILLQQMFAVGCAMGVASHFGAPIGGVLFSIEVTSTYYPLSTYASAFNCAIVGAIIYRYFWFETSFCPTYFTLDSWAYSELPWFGVLGVVMGVLGAVFVHFFAKVVERRRWFATVTTTTKGPRMQSLVAFINHPYVYGMMVAFLTAVLTFPGLARYMSLPGLFALQVLFSDQDMDDNNMNAHDWGTGGPLLWHLGLFIISRFFFLGISISMPLSSGMFVPLLMTGAAMGRLWGEVLRLLLPQLHIHSGIEYIDLALGWHIAPGGYALVGAAAYAAAATHSFSCAVIIFEISGNIAFALPTILAVGLAVFTSRMFSISIYDKISITRGLPWLPELPQSMYGMTVADVMNTSVQFLTYDATPQKIASLLGSQQKHKVYPIVNNSESMMVVGMVYRKDLLKFLLHSSTVLDWHTPVTMESSLTDNRDVIPGLSSDVFSSSGPGKGRRVLYIKPAPVQLLSSTPLAHCQMLFITLRLTDAFVTSNSRLVGIVTRNDLRLAIGQRSFRPVVVFFKKAIAFLWAVVRSIRGAD